MHLMRTISTVAATGALALSLLVAPAATAATPTAVPAATSTASGCSKPVKPAKTSKAAPQTAPKGYFAVAVYGSLRKGEVKHCKMFESATAYTSKPYMGRVAGHLKFGKSPSDKYAILFPGKGTVKVEVYYYLEKERAKILATLDKYERVKSAYNKSGSYETWYKRTSATYATVYHPVLPLKYLQAQTYYAGTGWKGLLKGQTCIIKDGDYKNRNKPGGCK